MVPPNSGQLDCSLQPQHTQFGVFAPRVPPRSRDMAIELT